MRNREPIGVVFDVDGVLVDSAQAHFESWRCLGKELRIEVTERQFRETFGRRNSDIIPLLFGESSPGRDKVLADRKEAIYRDLIRSHPPIDPGAVDLVRACHDQGMRLAVGSSGPRANINLVLKAMRVLDLIEAIVSGDDVQEGKPHPEVFQGACDRLGLAPSRCVVVEDAPAGVQAARSAGAWCAAILRHHTRADLFQANLVVPQLSDLSPELLRSLLPKESCLGKRE